MTGEAIVGVDAGTTTIKAAAFAIDGTELARSDRPTPVENPGEGRVEQDATETWNRAAATIESVVDAIDRTVVAVGVTGQGSGAWLIDENGEPVRDAILWRDARAAEYVETWHEDGTFDAVFDRCGYALYAGASFALYRWLLDEEPSVADRTETAFFCKDWLKFRLTGERTTDPSDVSITHYRPDRGVFDDRVADRLGVRELAECVPPRRSGTDVVGHVTDEAAEQTGLSPGVPVVSGVVDVAASAFGCGAVAAGDCSSVVGTTLQSQVTLPSPVIESPRSGQVLDAGVEGIGIRAAGAMTGTPNLDWLRETVFDGDLLEEIESRVASLPVGADGVMYHPYLNRAGEKAPFVDPAVRAQFTGLQLRHDEAHLARAVYEGVALALRDCYSRLPTPADRVYLCGGGSRSAVWCQIIADCLDAAVVVPAGREFGAKGVALLGGLALGRYDDLEDAAERTTVIDSVYEPRADAADRYDRWYDVYCDTRDRLRETSQRRRSFLDES